MEREWFEGLWSRSEDALDFYGLSFGSVAMAVRTGLKMIAPS